MVVLLKVISELEAAIIKAIKEKNYNKKAKPTALLKYKHDISQFIMFNVFKQNKFKSYKTTKKSSLIEEMRKTWYIFYKMHKH